MSTHNICIRREIRKILFGYPLLSVAMSPGSSVYSSSQVLHIVCYCYFQDFSRFLLKTRTRDRGTVKPQ